jgi:Bacterial alpha-L-rhamnosidase 6 hairpin glycosidase domain
MTAIRKCGWVLSCNAAAVLGLAGCATAVAPVNSESSSSYILSPSSRTLEPVAVAETHGQVVDPASVLSGEATELRGHGSYVVLDFGKEVGGIISLQFGSASDTQQSLGLAFSESSLYTGMESDHSDSGGGGDGYLSVDVVPNGSYVVPAAKLRGGFRYLTIGLLTSGSADITGVSLQFTAAPMLSDLRAYKGSFESSDDTLNRIWYAGAYTVQLDTIDPTQGGVYPPPYAGWLFNGVIGSGTTILVDGAKRDRFVWPGDLGISALTAYVSTGDTLSVKNDLNTLFAMQDPDGGLPYVGPTVDFGVVSDTYHLWSLDAVIDYYLYSGDQAWLAEYWPQIRRAVLFSLAKIDTQGLMSVNLTADWGRQSSGGEEISANALLYHVLRGMAFLASEAGDGVSSTLYDTQASSLRIAIQSQLWDGTEGMYRDTPGSLLYPQDGNSLALWFGVPDTASQQSQICSGLRQRWNRYGAVTTERPGSIATFPGSMEVLGRFAAGDDAGAMELMRLEWGYMLASPAGSGSTFWEGYLQDGSFDYGGPVMSLAHGWATGPTTALTQYAAGVGPDLSASVPFHFIPHMGTLVHASATVSLAQGRVAVSWERTPGRFEGRVVAPASMAGRYGVPVDSTSASVFVDGAIVWSSCSAIVPRGVGVVSHKGGYVFLSQVAGSHTVISTDTCS